VSTSRPLPNFFALYLLPWALMSWSVARSLGVHQDEHRDKIPRSEADPVPAPTGEVAPGLPSDDEVLTPDEEVRLLHILE
jgi:hypothetical protein